MATRDYRIGMRAELHPATDAWMRGDRYGDIVSVSAKSRSFIDPSDPRNGRIFAVRMDRSGRILRVLEGDIARVFHAERRI